MSNCFIVLYYSVTTYVTEDGQTGHLIIGNANNYPTDVSSSGIVTLGDTNITTAIASPDGSVLSLGEEAMEQLAGIKFFFLKETFTIVDWAPFPISDILFVTQRLVTQFGYIVLTL